MSQEGFGLKQSSQQGKILNPVCYAALGKRVQNDRYD